MIPVGYELAVESYVRLTDFGFDGVHLDNAAFPKYPRHLPTRLVKYSTGLTNPHSHHSSSIDIINKARSVCSSFFGLSRNHSFVFTSGATEGFRLVNDIICWENVSNVFTTQDSHHSALAVALCAKNNNKNIIVNILQSFIDLENQLKDYFNHPDQKPKRFVFILTGESNFSGRKIMNINETIQSIRSFIKNKGGIQPIIIFDAAKYAASHVIDFTTDLIGADFVVLSLYKLFGLPTGLGGLVIDTSTVIDNKHTLPILDDSKIFPGGGTLKSVIMSASKENNSSSNHEIIFKRKDILHERLEAGTPNVQALSTLIPSMRLQLEWLVHALMAPELPHHTMKRGIKSGANSDLARGCSLGVRSLGFNGRWGNSFWQFVDQRRVSRFVKAASRAKKDDERRLETVGDGMKNPTRRCGKRKFQARGAVARVIEKEARKEEKRRQREDGGQILSAKQMHIKAEKEDPLFANRNRRRDANIRDYPLSTYEVCQLFQPGMTPLVAFLRAREHYKAKAKAMSGPGFAIRGVFSQTEFSCESSQQQTVVQGRDGMWEHEMPKATWAGVHEWRFAHAVLGEHSRALAKFAVSLLRTSKHENGSPLVKLHGWDIEDDDESIINENTSSIVAFTLLDKNGMAIAPQHVQKFAALWRGTATKTDIIMRDVESSDSEFENNNNNNKSFHFVDGKDVQLDKDSLRVSRKDMIIAEKRSKSLENMKWMISRHQPVAADRDPYVIPSGILLRSGCMCNSGGCAQFLHLNKEVQIANFDAGLGCGRGFGLGVNGNPMEVVRASFHHTSTLRDATVLVDCMRDAAVKLEEKERSFVCLSPSRDNVGSSDDSDEIQPSITKKKKRLHSTPPLVQSCELRKAFVYPFRGLPPVECKGPWPLHSFGLLADRELGIEFIIIPKSVDSTVAPSKARVLTSKMMPDLDKWSINLSRYMDEIYVSVQSLQSHHMPLLVKMKQTSDMARNLPQIPKGLPDSYMTDKDLNCWMELALTEDNIKGIIKSIKGDTEEEFKLIFRLLRTPPYTSLGLKGSMHIIFEKSVEEIGGGYQRYRPNLIVGGLEPREEYSWIPGSRILVSGLEGGEFVLEEHCVRCERINFANEGQGPQYLQKVSEWCSGGLPTFGLLCSCNINGNSDEIAMAFCGN